MIIFMVPIMSVPYIIITLVSMTVYSIMTTRMNKNDNTPIRISNKSVWIISFVVYIVSNIFSLIMSLIFSNFIQNNNQNIAMTLKMIAYIVSFSLSIFFYYFLIEYNKTGENNYLSASIILRLIEFSLVAFAVIILILEIGMGV